MPGQTDWTWLRLSDALRLPDSAADGGPAGLVYALKSVLEETFRKINVNMKKLENAVAVTGKTIDALGTFANGATTPDVSQAAVWKTNNSAPTTIANFLGGVAGRLPFTLVAGDANTTIQNNANIVTKTGANRVLVAGAVTQFVTTDGAVWREVPT